MTSTTKPIDAVVEIGGVLFVVIILLFDLEDGWTARPFEVQVQVFLRTV
jgi:hypothetical protein